MVDFFNVLGLTGLVISALGCILWSCSDKDSYRGFFLTLAAIGAILLLASLIALFVGAWSGPVGPTSQLWVCALGVHAIFLIFYVAWMGSGKKE